jgi:hypothetical protein
VNEDQMMHWNEHNDHADDGDPGDPVFQPLDSEELDYMSRTVLAWGKRHELSPDATAEVLALVLEIFQGVAAHRSHGAPEPVSEPPAFVPGVLAAVREMHAQTSGTGHGPDDYDDEPLDCSECPGCDECAPWRKPREHQVNEPADGWTERASGPPVPVAEPLTEETARRLWAAGS